MTKNPFSRVILLVVLLSLVCAGCCCDSYNESCRPGEKLCPGPRPTLSPLERNQITIERETNTGGSNTIDWERDDCYPTWVKDCD